MAVTFHCSCGRALIADEAHRGMEVRCPSCGLSLRVPGASDPSIALSVPGPASARVCGHCAAALSPTDTTCPKCGAFLETRAPSQRICPKCGAQVSLAAASCPACAALLGPPAPSSAPPPGRPGLPWEHRASLGLFRAAWQTARMVILEPRSAFLAMTPDDELRNPLTYYLLLYVAPGTLALAALGGILVAGWATLAPKIAEQMPQANLSGIAVGTAAGIYLAVLVLVPVLNVVSQFAISGLVHLGLMLAGGARRSFATTFAAVAYSMASTNLVQLALCCVTMIPYVGMCFSLALWIWTMAWIVIALVHAHETDTWRALLAVFGPFVLCCGLGFGLVFLAGLMKGVAAGGGL